MRMNPRPPWRRLLAAVALLLLASLLTACPQAEVLQSFQVSAPATVTAGEPFTLTVTAVGSVGTTPFAAFSGSIDLAVDSGTIAPASLTANQGVGTVQVTLSCANDPVVITASAQKRDGTAQASVNSPVLLGDPNDPAGASIPTCNLTPREEDYSEDHPDLPGAPLSINTLVLVFELGTTVEQANGILTREGAFVVGGIPGVTGQAEGILFLRVPTENHQAMIDLLARLRADPLVKYAVQDGLLDTSLVPQPNGGTPAGWTWQATPGGGNWGMERIRAPQLWNLNAAIEKSGTTTPTGVLDVGFANSHEDLVYDQNLTVGTQADHGTHVAGTIAATFDNGVGVDGVTRFADLVVNAPAFSGSGSTLNVRTSWGQQMSAGFFGLINARNDVLVVNASLGYNWGPAGINQNTNTAVHDLVENQGAIFALAELIHVLIGKDLPVFVVAAGNDSNDISAPGGGFVLMEARWSSPFAYAGLELDMPNIIVVESVADSGASPGGATRSSFSNLGGDISAPGSSVLSTSWRSSNPTAFYETMSGTSMASPHVTGLISYLFSVDPSLLHSEIVDLLVANSVTVAGGASPRIDAFATVMDIDRVQGGDAVLRMLLDIDDGTPDGNQRLLLPSGSGDFVNEDADADGGIGDGGIDMADFRRWRDWLLQVENPAGLTLDGSAGHPKKDVNGNGNVQSASNENIYPRGDFNGDGQLSRTALRFVPGAVDATVTDLGVLQELFSDSNYTAAELPNLVSSADLEIWPDTCLRLAGVASVESFIRVSGTTTVLETRTHTLASGPRQVYTAAVDPAGYTARVEAKDAGGTTLFSNEQVFPFTLGSDAFWDPECTTEGDGEGGSWGDPHLVTFDGLKYDFQSVGEFILVESTSDDLIVQVRQQPWGSSDRVSVNTAVASNLNGQEVGLYSGETPPLRVDGTPTAVADGGSLALGTSRVDRSGNVYTLVWPSGETVAVTVQASYLNVNLNLLASRGGAIAGLLGQFDGTTANDIALRTGTVLTQPIAFSELYGTYADSWRISNAESLFHYGTGEDTGTFTDLDFPSTLATTGDLDPGDRDAAEATCLEAGVTDLIVLEACILDVGVTGESDFATDAAAITPPVDELDLTQPDLIVVSGDIALGQTCEPGAPILYVTTTVENIGTAASPERLDVGLVNSLDVAGTSWGNGIGLPSIPPGGLETVTFPIYYLVSDPPYMVGTHEFDLVVNRGGWIDEADTSNNTYSPNLQITIPPEFCPQLQPTFTITSYQLNPASPATLPFSPEGAPCPTGGTVFITGTYEKNVADPVLIFARPFTQGSPTPSYGASGSIEHVDLVGSFDQYFCLRDDVTQQRPVDQLRLTIERPGTFELLFEEFVDVDYLFVRPRQVCIDFEDPPFKLGTLYGTPAGDSPGDLVFTEQGVSVTVENFTLGTFTGFTNAEVRNDSSLPGQSMWISNINLKFDFSGLAFTVGKVTFDFEDLGGEENIAVNGSAIVEGGLASGNVGGVPLTIVGGTGVGDGTLDGTVRDLKIGGQEFYLDNVCAFEVP